MHLMMLASFPLLAGLGGVGLMIANAQQAQKKVGVRLAHIAPAAPVRTGPLPIARVATRQGGLLAPAASLLGFDPARRLHYPLPWWLVVAASGGIGWLASELASGMLGAVSPVLWPVVWLLASRTVFGAWDGKRRTRMLEQFPDALAMIVRTVRVGIPVAEGIRLVGREAEAPTGGEFLMLAEELAIGVPLEEGLRALAARTGMPEYRFFATTVVLQAQTGGGLSEALETLADVVRKRVALKARGYALASEARTSAMVLCALPFVAGGTMLVLTPDYMNPLFTTATGHMMLAIAGFSLVVGVAVMRGLIRRTLA
jgi:tight adherence protein B